jgi:SPP1 family predicted phage head-tail adaptor
VTAPAPAISGLRDRVQVFSRQTTAEEEGGHLTVFVPAGTLWARVTATGARQVEIGDGRTAAMTHTVVVRHRTGISPGDRFVHRGRKLEVLSAEDLTGRRQFLACRCAECVVTG